MKCENCGSKIKKGETYCPKCGMELFNSQYKPLKKKYLRGEYREVDDLGTSPYNLDEDDYSESAYQQDNYQNQNYNQKRKKNYQKNYNQETNPQKKYQRGYDLDEYYESEETGSSMWGTIMLLLIVALLFGFVMGFMFFSTKL
ncbi:MAG TPA: zinc ribbon domain-containing protein [Methanobacterium sp.]|nr:zinc ribbon domain-containing protein [Methanobacterium sp.]